MGFNEDIKILDGIKIIINDEILYRNFTHNVCNNNIIMCGTILQRLGRGVAMYLA